MEAQIKVTGQNDLMGWVRKHGTEAEKDVKRIILNTGNNIRTDWMQNLAKKVKSTTKSKQSIQMEITKNGYGGAVFSGLDELTFIEYGTRPHTIRIKRKKVLANVKTGDVFGKKVEHPGTQPKPCLTPAAHKHLNKMENDLLALMRGNK